MSTFQTLYLVLSIVAATSTAGAKSKPPKHPNPRAIGWSFLTFQNLRQESSASNAANIKDQETLPKITSETSILNCITNISNSTSLITKLSTDHKVTKWPKRDSSASISGQSLMSKGMLNKYQSYQNRHNMWWRDIDQLNKYYDNSTAEQWEVHGNSNKVIFDVNSQHTLWKIDFNYDYGLNMIYIQFEVFYLNKLFYGMQSMNITPPLIYGDDQNVPTSIYVLLQTSGYKAECFITIHGKPINIKSLRQAFKYRIHGEIGHVSLRIWQNEEDQSKKRMIMPNHVHFLNLAI